MDGWLKQCCLLYNAALEQRITGWRMRKHSFTRYEQQVQLTELRASDEAWSSIPLLVQRSALRRVELAYAAFFRRVKKGETPGFPRFKSSRRYDSFSIGSVRVKDGRVFIPKLGHVKLKLYREIRGEILNTVISRNRAGKWEVSFQCDLGAAPEKCTVKTKVGIDLGLITLATLSTGEEIANPRFAKRAADLLAKRQQKLARKRKGSRNREAARILVAKAHAHIAKQRLNHAREEAKKLFEAYDEVMHEKLSIRGLAAGRFSKSFADVAWGVLLRCCALKAEEAGKRLTPKDPKGTSQRCSSCGVIVKKTLAERVHRCPNCGLEIGRDHNAAINVLNARLARSGADGYVGDEGKASL
jgi:putative transposase